MLSLLVVAASVVGLLAIWAGLGALRKSGNRPEVKLSQLQLKNLPKK